MINSYLNVLRLDAGSQPLQISSIDPEDLVKQVFDVLQPLAIANGIRLTFPRASESVLASGDRNLIHGAVLNLVSNAIKYGEQGTEVLVTWNKSDHQTVIVVENQGTSISEEELHGSFALTSGLQMQKLRLAGAWVWHSLSASPRSTVKPSP